MVSAPGPPPNSSAANIPTTRSPLLFTDVLIEDSDLYRFNADASTRLGIPITRVCDGRTQFELFLQRSYLGNARVAPCSQVLKQKPCRRWLAEHTDPADTVLYIGLEPGEQRRAPAITAGWHPWRVEYPLMQHPELTKDDLLAWCRNVGLTPRLYRFGFSLNSCGGLCVCGGHAHWHRTHEVFPDRFAWYAQLEHGFHIWASAMSIPPNQTVPNPTGWAARPPLRRSASRRCRPDDVNTARLPR